MSLIVSWLVSLLFLFLVYKLVLFGSDDTAIHLGQLCTSLSIFVCDRHVGRALPPSDNLQPCSADGMDDKSTRGTDLEQSVGVFRPSSFARKTK